MDLSVLDPSHGIRFAAKVRASTGQLVASSQPDELDNFWMIASFSRSRLKLCVSSAAAILQLVANLFCVVELEEHIFKFGVSSKSVGLLVYNLGLFECATFKVFFHLWNEKGLASARSSALSDRGSRFEWVEAGSKKKKKSFVDAVKSNAPLSHSAPTNQQFVPLTGANLIPVGKGVRQSVFSRLDFKNVSDSSLKSRKLRMNSPLGMNSIPAKKQGVSNSNFGGVSGIDLGLRLGQNLSSFNGINSHQETNAKEVTAKEGFQGGLGGVAAQWGLWPDAPVDDAFIGPLPPLQQNNNEVAKNAEGPEQEVEGPEAIPQEEPILEPVINDFDLNMAPAEDLGVIHDEVVQEEEDNIPLVEDVQVIDGTDSSGDSDNAQPPFLMNDMEVEVFIPQENGIPMQFIQDEIQEEELLGNNLQAQNLENLLDEQMAPQEEAPEEAQQYNMNMQLGFVQFQQPKMDPVLAARLLHSQPPVSKQHAVAVRAWAQYLAPGMGAEKVDVPKPWADFFTAMLLNPGNFIWAKNLLSSVAWEFFQTNEKALIPFVLPASCPEGANSACLNAIPFASTDNISLAEGETSPPATRDKKGKELQQDMTSRCTPPEKRGIHISPSTGPWSKALLDRVDMNKKNNAVVDTDLRRSDRNRQQQKGFKHASCIDKSCLGCNSKPPTISPSLIKNLGASFCKIDPAKLTDEMLGKKRKATAPGGKKPAVKKPSKDNDDDAAKGKKNFKRPPKK
ncbi:unnamed protein product [Urochloa decumbens]|uniref:Uncharacterized protein n=1 Tax=Urochloa decumbens TaxID=240449 RepID=A0ABC8W189_9POAL